MSVYDGTSFLLPAALSFVAMTSWALVLWRIRVAGLSIFKQLGVCLWILLIFRLAIKDLHREYYSDDIFEVIELVVTKTTMQVCRILLGVWVYVLVDKKYPMSDELRAQLCPRKEKAQVV